MVEPTPLKVNGDDNSKYMDMYGIKHVPVTTNQFNFTTLKCQLVYGALGSSTGLLHGDSGHEKMSKLGQSPLLEVTEMW